MEVLDHGNSVWLHFFHLTPYSEREKNPLMIAHFFCLWQEFNLGSLRSKQVRNPLLHCLSATATLQR